MPQFLEKLFSGYTYNLTLGFQEVKMPCFHYTIDSHMTPASFFLI